MGWVYREDRSQIPRVRLGNQETGRDRPEGPASLAHICKPKLGTGWKHKRVAILNTSAARRLPYKHTR